MSDDDTNKVVPLRGGRAACPICGKPTVREQRPFCSARCRAVDLNRWFGEVYEIPTDDFPSSDEENEH